MSQVIGRRERKQKFAVTHIPVEQLLHDKRGNVHGKKPVSYTHLTLPTKA